MKVKVFFVFLIGVTILGCTNKATVVNAATSADSASTVTRPPTEELPVDQSKGSETPEADGRVGVNDTLGVSLKPEYSVFSSSASIATFILYNQRSQHVSCGARYSITYEDEQGVWRSLPMNMVFNDLEYRVRPGDSRLFIARLYPEIHPNKPGRYRFFYGVTINPGRTNLAMMTEFRLTDNQQELSKAVKRPINQPTLYNSPSIEDIPESDIYDVVDTIPEFPGGSGALLAFIKSNMRYPRSALDNSVQGRVLVQVVIAEDGSVTRPIIVRSIDARLDKEALRIAGIMPKWKPGQLNGKVVKSIYIFSVDFRLSEHVANK